MGNKASRGPPTSTVPRRKITVREITDDTTNDNDDSFFERSYSGSTVDTASSDEERKQKRQRRRSPDAVRSTKVTTNTREMKPEEINEAVRDSVFAYFDSVQDVPSDGNCGYYVLYDFLQEQGLLPKSCSNITDLRRLIYNFAKQWKNELLSSSDNYFNRLGYWRVRNDPTGKLSEQVFWRDISKIYNENVDFENGCNSEYWMNANIVMPLVALYFHINIWVLSADGDPYVNPETGTKVNDEPYTTMYTVTDDGEDVNREIVRGCVAFPLDLLRKDRSPTAQRTTAHVIHVQGNHYVAAKRK